MEQAGEKVWYAMSAVYNHSLYLKEKLEEQQIECFVPMQYRVVVKGKTKRRELVPVIRNLIFIRTTEERIKELKQQYLFLQYLIVRTQERAKPIIVPDGQMRSFIAVAGTHDEYLLYFNPDEINLQAGDRVRITRGIFEGVEGIYMKVKGARDRRVVVSIQGVASIATTSVEPDWIEKIQTDR